MARMGRRSERVKSSVMGCMWTDVLGRGVVWMSRMAEHCEVENSGAKCEDIQHAFVIPLSSVWGVC